MLVIVIAAAPAPRCPAGEPGGYDPTKVRSQGAAKTLELRVHDAKRGRDIPLRLILPSRPPSPAPPVILFSHGLGGSRQTSQYLGTHWAARGYAVAFPQHPGSDHGVWKDKPVQQRRAALIQAASRKNAQDRIEDIHVVLEQLHRWVDTPGHPLQSRLDLTRVGMSGHSFGALTTQAIGGQSDPSAAQPQRNLPIRAAIAMSPSVPPRAELREAFASVRIPWLMMTGSQDYAPIGQMTPEARRDVFNHLPPSIDRYELVLGGAHHFAFTDNDLPPRVPPRNVQHHVNIVRISTAFWDAYLRGDAAAKEWLQGPAIRATLAPEDRWRIGLADGSADADGR